MRPTTSTSRSGEPRARARPASCAAAGLVALLAGCDTGLGASPRLRGTPLRPPTRSSGCAVRGAEPDPGCTPGAVLGSDPTKICMPGYARSVRDVSYALKRRVYAAYG